MTEQKQTVYDRLSERICTELAAGTVPWRRPWRTEGRPYNRVSNRAYTGINLILLGLSSGTRESGSNAWITYKQAEGLGGHVRRGDRGTGIVFFKPILRPEKTDPITGEAILTQGGVWREYTVFHVSQCENLPSVDPQPVPQLFAPIARAEQIATQYLATGPTLAHGGDRACYAPSIDHVQMPRPESFTIPAAYYSTLYHELAHSTGHVSRLDRAGIGHDLQRFGTETYSREELVAEIASAFLAADAGIDHDIPQVAAYCRAWLRVLQGDRRLILTAAAQASKAADYVTGAVPVPPTNEE